MGELILIIGGALTTLTLCWVWGRAGLTPLRSLARSGCGSCGYDLSGLAVSAACPECGSLHKASTERQRRRVPRWLIPVWLLGACAAHMPAVLLLIAQEFEFDVGLVLMGAIHPALVLVCALLTARRPSKRAVVVVLAAAFIPQLVLELFLVRDLILDPPKGFLSGLVYVMVPFQAELLSGVVLLVVSAVGAVVTQIRPARVSAAGLSAA